MIANLEHTIWVMTMIFWRYFPKPKIWRKIFSWSHRHGYRYDMIYIALRFWDMDIDIISGFGLRYGIWYYIGMKRYFTMTVNNWPYSSQFLSEKRSGLSPLKVSGRGPLVVPPHWRQEAAQCLSIGSKVKHKVLAVPPGLQNSRLTAAGRVPDPFLASRDASPLSRPPSPHFLPPGRRPPLRPQSR